MVKVYAIALTAGIAGLLVLILGGSLAGSLGRGERDPGARVGRSGKTAIGAAVGLGMGGLSAEFSPLELAWPVSLSIALVAAVSSVFWVRYAVRQSEVR
jgi:hypothetical protein